MSTRIRYETLTGQQKAAVFMLAISEEQAAELFAKLDMDEVRDISQTMSKLGRVDSEVVELLFEEFRVRLRTGGGVAGGYETTEKLLSRFLEAERVEAIMEEIRGPAGRTVWDKLGNIDEAVLSAYLRNEYPQTVAVVLSRMEPSHAARVLATLPEELALDAVMRMLRMDVVQKDILSDVEKTLRAEFVSNLAKTSRRDNHEIMAEIFNHFDKVTESRIMGELDRVNREAADRIRSLMFTFEDLAKVDPQSTQLLIRRAGPDRLTLALKGGDERVREHFLANMSERAGKMLRDSMKGMGPVRLRDVEEAQQFLVNLAKELAAAGEIALNASTDEELVY
jgi:flagellar motor switch protein FliG